MLPLHRHPPITSETYAFLEQFIYDATGIALGHNKEYLLESRLLPLVKEERLGSLNDLPGRLRRGANYELRRRIAECMTTHETMFFRDPATFEMMRSEILPELADRRRTSRELRIWSAACSSGQEPYSMAMLLFEMGFASWKVDILATDLSSRILARARAGRYPQLEVNRGMPAHLLVKYFRRDGLDWQIRDEVRRAVRFRALDLRQSMAGLGPFDLVLCRNVLIYFDLTTRENTLTEIRRTLRPGGYLVLGTSETIFNLHVDFERRTMQHAIAYRKGATP
jgi:chemotaxis protein methyltransferase CheR